jgi:hypothetical protein
MHASRRRFLLNAGGAATSLLLAPRLLGQPIPAALAQAIPGSPSFRGAAGKAVVGPVALNAGVTVLRVQHNGTGNFGITLAMPNDGYSPQDAFAMAQVQDYSLVYDIIGPYKGGAVALATMGGDHYLAVNASGAWQVDVEQPLPETVSPVQQTSFTSKGQDVTPYFLLPDGIQQISLQAPTTSTLLGYLYHIDDLGGAAVQAGLNGYDGRAFDFTNPANQVSYPLSPADAGPYVFYVTNDIRDDTPWTVSFA